jgi:hypothetical protein
MKKALMPLLIIVIVLVVLLAAAHWYERRYGVDGPFPRTGHR